MTNRAVEIDLEQAVTDPARVAGGDLVRAERLVGSDLVDARAAGAGSQAVDTGVARTVMTMVAARLVGVAVGRSTRIARVVAVAVAAILRRRLDVAEAFGRNRRVAGRLVRAIVFGGSALALIPAIALVPIVVERVLAGLITDAVVIRACATIEGATLRILESALPFGRGVGRLAWRR